MKTNKDIPNQINRLLKQKVTGRTKDQLFLNGELNREQKQKLEVLESRYVQGEPIEYILESAEFYCNQFIVNKNVLIPRNDTEVMVDEALKEYNKKKHNSATFIDVGTGSGAIIISILKNISSGQMNYAIDISEKALSVAHKNIQIHNLENSITQINGNLLRPVLNFHLNDMKNYDHIYITANLPYIKDNDHENMSQETITYEPDLALYGGKKTGFELYEELIEQCLLLTKYNKNITLFIEIGFDQYDYSHSYLQQKGLHHNYYKDNSGIYRCIKIDIE